MSSADTTRSRFARVPEPELMLGEEQTRAYAEADFEAAHSVYASLFRQRFPDFPREAVLLDIGCGPCDVTRRFACLSSGWRIDAVDGSPAMIARARQTVNRCRLRHRIRLIEGRLPELGLPRERYDIILASSLLHHLPDPRVLWQAVTRFSGPGTIVFVADLRRPLSKAEAKRLVDTHAAGEPALLRRDFHNSLLAAFTPGEVREQLNTTAQGALKVEALGDRHLLVSGVV